MKWSIIDGVLTVSCKGNLRRPTSHWSEYVPKIKTLIIEEGCTRIGPDAFREYPALETVILPKHMNSIARNAFLGCPQLRSVTMPETLSVGIGAKAFYISTRIPSKAFPQNTFIPSAQYIKI